MTAVVLWRDGELLAIFRHERARFAWRAAAKLLRAAAEDEDCLKGWAFCRDARGRIELVAGPYRATMRPALVGRDDTFAAVRRNLRMQTEMAAERPRPSDALRSFASWSGDRLHAWTRRAFARVA